MSEKFNPLAEATSNASHDRRRFYDWVGDNADHADNESFRAANEDMADYLTERDYEDDNGSLHAAEGGRFKTNPNNESDDEYYNRLQAESEIEGPFADKSLKEIAEMVREARASSDKTLEGDARAVFDDKFMEMAEKYDWQGTVENADGTVTDRNAIADKKLAYYESIMDGELEASVPSETVEKSEQKIDDSAAEPVDTEQEAETNSEESSSQQGESAADETTDTEQAYVPKHRAEYQDEESPIYDELKSELEGDDADVEEGESLEEFEARQPGKRRSAEANDEDLEILPVEGAESVVDDDDLEILPVDEDDAEEVAPRYSRLRRFGTPSGLMAEASAWAATRERGGRRRNRVVAGLGGAALLVGGGLLLFKGHNISDLADIVDKAKDDAGKKVKKSGEIAKKAHEIFGDGNVEVRPGDGYTQVIDRVLDGNDIHLSSKELYDLHQHIEHAQGEYIDLNGARDTYVMPNGDTGLSRPDRSAQVSEATQKAVVRWLKSRGKI